MAILSDCAWLSLETAPRNGTMILLRLGRSLHSNEVVGYVPWTETRVALGWWLSGDFELCFSDESCADTEGYSTPISHTGRQFEANGWMPLPDADPKQGGEHADQA